MKKTTANSPLQSLRPIEQRWERWLRPLRDRHNRHYRDSYFQLWADLLLLGILVGLVVIVIWLSFWRSAPVFMVSLRPESSRMLSGQEETFIIEYQNLEDGPVTAAQIALDLPRRFTVTQAEPAGRFDSATRSFTLGTLKPGEKGELKLKGVVEGSLGERQAIGFAMSYYYKQVRKQSLEAIAFYIDGSALQAELEAPDRAYQGAGFRAVLHLTNTGSRTLEDVSLFVPGTEWTVSPDGQPASRDAFSLGKLEAGQSRDIDLIAVSDEQGERELAVELSVGKGEDSILQARAVRRVSVAAPSLRLSGSFAPTVVAAVASRSTVSLSLRNLEESALEDVTITILPAGKRVSVSRLVSATSGIIARGNSLSFGNLQASETREVRADIELERESIEPNDQVSLSAAVGYRYKGETYDYVMPLGVIRFASNLTMESGAYYYGPQGDQLGVGPLPPKVDIPTTYWVIWQINNLGNDVSDLSIQAELPATVVWADQQSLTAGDLSYSPVTRRVIWKPGTAGRTGGNYRVSFAVTIQPRAKDIGTIPVLLRSIVLSGKDTFTGGPLERVLPDLSANLTKDARASGKGTVELN